MAYPERGGAAAVSPWQSRMLSVFRVVVGILYLSHGLVKLFGVPEGVPPGQVQLFSLYGLPA